MALLEVDDLVVEFRSEHAANGGNGGGRRALWQGRERALELLRTVRIPVPDVRFGQDPHQFSGGMRQRAMIAMALMCRSPLLIADEPTTALDATVELQVIELLKELQRRFGMEPGGVDVRRPGGGEAQIVNLLLDLQAHLGLSSTCSSPTTSSGPLRQRPDRGHVSRPHRRARPGRGGRLAAAPSLHPAAAGSRAPSRSGAPRGDRGGAGRGAGPARPALRLRLPPRCPLADACCRRERPELRAITPAVEVACHRYVEVACHRYEEASDPVPALTVTTKKD